MTSRRALASRDVEQFLVDATALQRHVTALQQILLADGVDADAVVVAALECCVLPFLLERLAALGVTIADLVLSWRARAAGR